MKYQIRSLLLLVFVLFLVGCDQRTLPPKKYKLDEGVMTQLLLLKEEAIRKGDAAAVKGFYSKGVTVDVTSPQGRMFQNTYAMIARQADINAEYGKGFHTEVLERIVYVSAHQDKAVVQQRIRETWLFNANYNDVLVESVHRMEWELINNIPQITKVSKRILEQHILNEDDRRAPLPTNDA